MREIDLHRKRLHEAEEIFFQILDRARLSRKTEPVRFITGAGPIQERLRKLAARHDLEAQVPLANRGVVVIYFE